MRHFAPIVGIVNSWESCAPVIRRTAELASRLSTTASIVALPETALPLWSRRGKHRSSVDIRVRQLVSEMEQVHGVALDVSLPGSDVDVVRRVHDASRHAGLLVVNLTPPAFTPRAVFLNRLLAGARCPVLFPKALFPAPYENVLVPVDFSGRSHVAVEWASRLAPTAASRLMHVLRLKDEQAMQMLDVPHWVIKDLWAARVGRARAALAELSKLAVDDSTPVRDFAIRKGERLVDAVLKERATLRADLVVASMNAMDPLAELFGRPLTVQLARHASCDVLALPPKFLPRPRRVAEPMQRRRLKAGGVPMV